MTPDNGAARSAAADIDRVMHEPARYSIMALLYVVEEADFLFARNHTGLTAGNLSSHLAKLETAGYVAIKKRFVRKKPHTTLRATREGRAAFDRYRERMKELFTMLPEIGKESEND
jgi:DNA-binding MarR family transcriptional regulator